MEILSSNESETLYNSGDSSSVKTPVSKNSDSFTYRYDEYLNDYADVKERHRAEHCSLYRWSHNPFEERDGLPQLFQADNPVNVDSLISPTADAPLEVRINFVNNFSLSHFTSQEAAIKRFLYLYNRLSKKKGQATAQEFALNKGQWVVKMNYTPETARLGDPDEKTGHVDVFLEKSADFKSLIDKEYEPINILDYGDAT